MGIETAILASAAAGLYSANKASKTQAQAAQQGIDAQQQMFNKQVELQAPWQKAGEEALNKLIPLASNYTPFGMSQFQQDPGAGLRYKTAMEQLEKTAAARGGLLSGATLKGVSRYNQDLTSQEYQNAFNRYQIERNAQLNPLQSLAGLGQTSTNTLTNAAGQMGQNYATGYGNVGQARASGYLGGTNALTSALGTGINYAQNQQYINRLPIPGGASPYGSMANTASPSLGYDWG